MPWEGIETYIRKIQDINNRKAELLKVLISAEQRHKKWKNPILIWVINWKKELNPKKYLELAEKQLIELAEKQLKPFINLWKRESLEKFITLTPIEINHKNGNMDIIEQYLSLEEYKELYNTINDIIREWWEQVFCWKGDKESNLFHWETIFQVNDIEWAKRLFKDNESFWLQTIRRYKGHLSEMWYEEKQLS